MLTAIKKEVSGIVKINNDYAKLRRELLEYGIVNITNLFTEELVLKLSNEMFRLMDKFARRNDFLSPYTELTPRNLNTVSEKLIVKHGATIPEFYYSPQVKYALSQIAGEIIYDLPWTGERFVLNQLRNQNDTHGWHWDDYSYALVFIAEAPEKSSEGGLLECIPHTYWKKTNPNINHIVTTRNVSKYYFKPGSFYFMRSDTTLHRVTPIISNKRRMSLAISYCSESDLGKPIDHNTVTSLYGHAEA